METIFDLALDIDPVNADDLGVEHHEPVTMECECCGEPTPFDPFKHTFARCDGCESGSNSFD